eukprot:TRINITY_DN623_c0_g1_i1.p1 TRINITY_DN623_c0_g1~~TRINITY_DN623_c0_g1_i1.p1  ORF type:complete len:312 (-),score=48.11 TRINITY_DN623_c0_g1_i1:198-1133(-)
MVGVTKSFINLLGFVIGFITAATMTCCGWRYTSFLFAGVAGFLIICNILIVQNEPKLPDFSKKSQPKLGAVAITPALDDNEDERAIGEDVPAEKEIQRFTGPDRFILKRQKNFRLKHGFQIINDLLYAKSQFMLTEKYLNPEGLTMKEALRSPKFYCIILSVTLGQFVYSAALPNFVPHFLNQGLSTHEAGMILSITSIVAIFSKIIFAYLSEKITGRYALCLTHLVNSAGILIIAFGGNSIGAWLGGIIFGLGYGGTGSMLIICLLEAVGRKQFAEISGVVQRLQFSPVLSDLCTQVLFSIKRGRINFHL